MTEFLQHLINGISLGSIYALLALGYTLVFGVLRLINFAHGDVFMIGAFIAFYFVRAMGLDTHPSFAALIVTLGCTMAACAGVGFLIERLAYRPLRRAPRINTLITAVGVSMLLEFSGQLWFGADPRFFPQIYQPTSPGWNIGELRINPLQLSVLVISLVLMALLQFIVFRTRLGRAMRAVSYSHELASLMGIPTDLVISGTFMLGSALAGAAAVLVGLTYPKIDPLMGVLPGLKAFVAAVLGGIGNVTGAVVGALLLGLAEELLVGYWAPTYRDALAFGLLILVLLFKPTGLFGNKAAREGMKRWIVALILAAMAGWASDGRLDPYVAGVLAYAGINVILAVSLNLVNGFTGQFSMGHAGFMSVGAYVSAFLTTLVRASHPEWFVSAPLAACLFAIALLAGGCAASLAGYAVGLPSLRLKGDYLAIVTLGFGEIIRVVVLNIDAVGGARGLTGIAPLAGLGWICALGVVTVFVIWRLITSAHGRSLLAVREDEIAAEAMGVDTTRAKVRAFVVGAFFAGVAGGLFAHYLCYLNPSSFDFNKSFEVIIMVVLGGMGSISGSVIAAIGLTVLREALRMVQEWTHLDFRMILYSLVLIGVMLTRPRGLLGNRELWR